MTMGQQIFNPINFGFSWTEDWYTWDSKAGHTAAKQARNARIKELRQQGKNPRGFRLANQLISRGGIGSGQHHIQEVVTCYGVNY
jgi:hypothetical protein